MVVKSIDETGKPIEWEAADAPTGGGGVGSDVENLSMLIDADLLPAMFDETGAIITDGNGNVILKY
jgi:hypothetical protein